MRGYPAREQGYSLLENLIALLVLSFGILTSLSLQVTAAANVGAASQRSVAAQLAEDLLERLRTQVQANGEEFDVQALWDAAGPPAPACTRPSGCAGPVMLGFELADWRELLAGDRQMFLQDGAWLSTGGLIDAQACLITPASGLHGLYRIVLVWRSSMATANPHLDDPQVDACGNDPDRYGPGNAYRQVLSLSSYIGGPR